MPKSRISERMDRLHLFTKADEQKCQLGKKEHSHRHDQTSWKFKSRQVWKDES